MNRPRTSGVFLWEKLKGGDKKWKQTEDYIQLEKERAFKNG